MGKNVKCILLLLSVMLYSNIYAQQNYRSGDFQYLLNDLNSTATIIKNYNIIGVVSIPPTITYNDKIYSVVAIANNAFKEDKNLIEITIPESVISIGEYSFYKCENLEVVQLPSSLKEIKQHAFEACSNLKTISLPNNLEILGAYSFSKCKTLTQFNIPKNITNIEEGILLEDNKLTTINLHENVVTIGKLAFSKTGIATIYLPPSIKTIYSQAFFSSTKLSSIIIPENVEYIDDNAFYGCGENFNIIVESGNLKLGKNEVFYNNDINVIYVPDSRYDYYYKASDWYSYKDKIKKISDKTDDVIEYQNLKYQIIDKTNYTVKLIGTIGLKEEIDIPNIITINNSEYKVVSIGTYAFANNTTIKAVTIPKNVNNIADNSFYKCVNLSSVTILGNVSTIRQQAFYGCSSITNIILPNSVKILEQGVFGQCSSLKNITIPTGVTEISDNLFSECENLESISMPNSITYIGENSFLNCKKLTTITIPSLTKIIGKNAFKNCFLIEKITIPQNVESILDNSFNGCLKLNEITITSQNANLGTNVFEKLPEEFVIYVPTSRLSGYKSAQNWSNYASHIKTQGGQSDNILVNGLYYEIIDNTSKTVQLVGFETETENIEIPERVNINNQDYTVIYIASNAFGGSTKIKTIKVSETISEISSSAFDGISSSVKIQVYETKYPYYCTDPNWAKYLSQLDVIASINEFTDESTGLKYRVVGKEKKDVYIFGFTNNIAKDLTIPKIANYKEKQYTVIGIDNKGFKGCEKLVSITIPDYIVYFGNSTFSGCSSLSSIKLPSNITLLTDSMFCGCNSLTTIDLPTTVTSIEEYAFTNCSSLTLLEIPETVTSIGKFAFSGCGKLKKVNIPSNIKEIKENTFANCFQLDTIIFPQNLLKIGNKAFNNCRNLRGIEIPESVTYIDEYAFSGDDRLKLILVYSENASLGKDAFYNLDVAFIIYVPENQLEKYKSATNWNSYSQHIKPLKYSKSSFLYNGLYYRITDYENNYVQIFGYESLNSKIEIPDTVKYKDKEYKVTSIAEKTFENCSIPTTIILPESISYIGSSAFRNCRNLTTINIPENVTEIFANTFSDCPNLKGITIPSNVTSIANYAFANCKLLRTVILPDLLTCISQGVFQGCHKLNKINMPKALETISKSAFEDCYSLTELDFPESLKNIEEHAFYNCSALSSIQISKNLICLKDASFAECKLLEKIIIKPSNLNLQDNVFLNCPETMVIYVPNESYKSYISNTNWSIYKDYIKPFYSVDILTDFGCTASEKNNIILNNTITFSVESDFSLQIFVNDIDVTNQLSVEYNNYTLQLTNLESLKTIYAETTLNTKDGNVFQISKPSHLYWFIEYISKGGEYQKSNAELLTDIILNDKLNQKVEVNAFEDISQWYPYNKKTNNRNSCFAGTFDGKGHVIKGIYLSDNTLNNAGFFQQLIGTVKNLAIEDVYIEANDNVGVICGINKGNISNCSIEANIFGNENIGGLVGNNIGGTISNCYITGNVSGKNNVGAMCGINSGNISECISTASISYENIAGNICGSNTGNITNTVYLKNKSTIKAINGVDNIDNNVREITFVELASSSLPQGFSENYWTSGSTKSVSNLAEMYTPYLTTFGNRYQKFLKAEAKIEKFTKTYFTGRNLNKDGIVTIEYENYTQDVFNISDSNVTLTSPDMYSSGKTNVYGKVFDFEFIYSIYINLDPTVGVSNISNASEIRVWGYDNIIYIENAESCIVYIFNLSGQIIKQTTIVNQLEEINLSKGGIYLVRIGNKKFKIIM